MFIALHWNLLKAMEDHMGSDTVTCHQRQENVSALTPARQVSTRFTYPARMEG